MSIPLEEVASQALAARRQAVQAYDAILEIDALEALRSHVSDGKDREVLELAILMRKREARGAYEAIERRVDLFDKTALPAAAALPALTTFLSAERVLVDPVRFAVLVASYLFGAGIWWVCRWMAFREGRRARLGLARLGKVD